MKQKTRILIYILIAIAVVIIGSIAIINNHRADKPASAQEHLDFGRIYLADLSYEKAVLEFTEAIEIEPLNPDAYLGLAEAYVGMEDTEKAIEILEEGYDKTGDVRLKDMLGKLLPPEPEVTSAVTTTATTITTAEETTTVSTVAMAVVPDLSGLTEEEAIAACEAAGLQYSVSYDYSDEVEKGYVIGQTIPVNTSVAEGVSVPFVISYGINIVTTIATAAVPDEDFVTFGEYRYSTSSTSYIIVHLDNEITNEDIDKLNRLNNLTSLNLFIKNENFNDISQLKRLTLNNLTELIIEGRDCKINDINAISNFTNLTKFHILINNQISDISILSDLTNLEELTIIGGKISDISALENLNNLKCLDLNRNQIRDISVISKLMKLEELDLSNNKINDISALKSLTNLKVLDLSNNQISDINNLNDLTILKFLNLRGNQIYDINALKELTECEVLHLGANQIDNIDALKNLTKLNALSINSNKITEIAVLNDMTSLTVLNLQKNPISQKDVNDLKKELNQCNIFDRYTLLHGCEVWFESEYSTRSIGLW
ncbi:MAG: leucine-rich repeat domain-containing protein [Eubacterium sp.]|nr:leucine-rich repeat domain-containing protein [Eubacterium sp.]